MTSADSGGTDWQALAIERCPIAILRATSDGRIASVNHHAEMLTGYARAELIGTSIDLLILARFQGSYRRKWTRLVETLRGRTTDVEKKLQLLRKQGDEIAVEVRFSPLAMANDDQVLLYMADARDHSRAQRIEKHMATLVRWANDAIVTKTLDGVIRSWNPAAARLLGYTAAEIIGQPITRLLPPDRQDEETMILERLKSGQGVEHFETVRRHKNGSSVDVSLTISPLRDRWGVIVGASKIMRDISQRKQAESQLRRSNAELERINQQLDDFVYTASHDLQSPLNAVSAIAGWIIEDDPSLTALTHERLQLIQSRITRMTRLLRDVRDYARAGVDADSRSGTPVTAAALVEDIVATLAPRPGITILTDNLLKDTLVARAPLRQVLQNLIDNAIKHHDGTVGNIAVSVLPLPTQLRFSVADDGPGVPTEYRETVFEMFKTLRPRDQVEGSGMGLAFVRRIVERMGGCCGIDPNEPRGTRIWFDWPMFAKNTPGPS